MEAFQIAVLILICISFILFVVLLGLNRYLKNALDKVEGVDRDIVMNRISRLNKPISTFQLITTTSVIVYVVLKVL